MRKSRPIESHTFAGMEQAVQLQAQAAGEKQAEELTAKLIEPRLSINAATGRMEQDAPLFFGTIHPTLF